jgi:uncharacterized protein (DUF2237 family)
VGAAGRVECVCLAGCVQRGGRGGRTGGATPLGPTARSRTTRPLGDTGTVEPTARPDGGQRNVLGGPLEPCSADPLTGFYRDGGCRTGPEDLGSHTICAVVTAEFLAHQQRIGNDLVTPEPAFRFPGLRPGDRWCVTAVNWLRAHLDGAAAFVVLAATNEAVLDIVPLEVLRQHAVDVPDGPGALSS